MSAHRHTGAFLCAAGLRYGFLGGVLYLLSGCYVVRQGIGQVDILLHRRPVDEILAGDVPEVQKDKIRLILEAKAFGETELHLKKTDNYTTYFDTKGKPVSYAVTASRKDRFEPYTWWFPIVGTVPYKGFFDLEDARAQARELADEGYDVSLGTVGAYSTLGWFSDPIFSSMLDDPDEALVELILHELTHSTVYVNGRGDFNESLASFVGRQGALEFLRRRFGEDSTIYRRAIRRFADDETFDGFLHGLYGTLDRYYRTRPKDVLAGREILFAQAREDFATLRKRLHDDRYDWFAEAKLHNAFILGRRRYGRTETFRLLFSALGGDWAAFFRRVAAAAKEEDPFGAVARAAQEAIRR